MSLADRRGGFRCLFSALFDDPDYHILSTPARLALLTLRGCSQSNVAALFPCYVPTLAAQVGCSHRVLRSALGELIKGHWIDIDGALDAPAGRPILVWVRDALQADPHLRLSDDKHRKAIERVLAAAEPSPLVARFREHYGLGRPCGDPSKTLPRPFGDPSSPSTTPSTTPKPRPKTESENEQERGSGGEPSPTRDARSPGGPEGVSPAALGSETAALKGSEPPGSESAGDTEDSRTGPRRIGTDPTLAFLVAHAAEQRRRKGIPEP
jgi:hypothetical protein